MLLLFPSKFKTMQQSAMFVVVPFVILLSGVAIESATVKQKTPFEVRLPTETGARILRKELDFEVRLRILERRLLVRIYNLEVHVRCSYNI